MAKLVFLSPAFSGQEYRFAVERTTVGRGQENRLVIPHTSVSSAQCEILVNGPEVIVRDLGSRNGTVVNGEKLRSQQAPVKHDQIIRFGSIEARLDLEGDPDGQSSVISAIHEHEKAMRHLANPQPENPGLSVASDAAQAPLNTAFVVLPIASQLPNSARRNTETAHGDGDGDRDTDIDEPKFRRGLILGIAVAVIVLAILVFGILRPY